MNSTPIHQATVTSCSHPAHQCSSPSHCKPTQLQQDSNGGNAARSQGHSHGFSHPVRVSPAATLRPHKCTDQRWDQSPWLPCRQPSLRSVRTFAGGNQPHQLPACPNSPSHCREGSGFSWAHSAIPLTHPHRPP